ncbi:TrkH family potassium uptake protein [Granulosicoccaceae sp. 1_MG-2023]|nr:TrkH family potassium uptake protein [Granulosicoccaceae sp. 1_MG-2023]
MQYRVIQRVLGVLLAIFSLSLVPPLIVSLYFDDGALVSFLDAFILTLGTGLLLYWPARREVAQLGIREGFLVVVLFWSVLGLFGALPLYMHDPLDLSVAEAIFESLSGLTTTGATVIVGLDTLPESILFYRQEVQWLGGMGLIVLAVAILPMLGIGGMQLYKAEIPGPTKNKLTPRVAETAKALWYIYLTLTFLCGMAYWFAGMTPFDAIGHAFSTVAVGGFSTHDASLGYFNSRVIEMIAVVFMMVSGVNFALHFMAVRSLSVRPYGKDSEFKAYVLVLGLVMFITSGYLYITGEEGARASFFDGIFHAVSIGTTTGFTTREYYTWPGFLPVMLLFASFVGGCAGSTGGGMKVIRVLLLFKQGMRELTRLVHPKATLLVKVGNHAMPNNVIDAVWGFFATYVALFVLMLLVMMALGLDQVTAFSSVAACLNNLGPGLGEVGANYASLNDGPLLVLCVAMLLGRLEIFTFIVLFTPAFWRK